MDRTIWISIKQGEMLQGIHDLADLFMEIGKKETQQPNKERSETKNNAVIGAKEPDPNATKSNNQPAAPIVYLQHDSQRYQLQQERINAGLQMYRAYTQSEMEQRWNTYRLRTDKQLEDERLYFVQCIDLVMLCICRVDAQLKPLSNTYVVERDEQGEIISSNKELSEQVLRSIEIAATRALYALWLDIGSVLVAVSGMGSVAIRKAWSVEQTDLPFERDALRAALNQWLQKWQADDTGQRMLLGADPEMIFVDKQNKLVKASDLLLEFSSAEIGIDALQYRGHIIYPIAELRPFPVNHPTKLLNSLYRLLKELNELVEDQNVTILAGAMPYKGIALGGHLHISGVTLTPRLLRLLDVMLALPFAALSDDRGSLRNRKYGSLGDYRKQFHGGFEYRTLPSWLLSPALAQAAIYTFWLTVQERQALAEHITNQPEGYELEKIILTCEQGTREERYKAAEASIAMLMKVSSDAGLTERLQPLMRALQNRITWDESLDIRTRWKLLATAK